MCLRHFLFFVFFSGPVFLCAQQPLKNAHSHNDYKQKHPLTDALKNGFTSVEADVFLINGSLVVAHTHPFLNRVSLEELYLKPLKDSVSKHQGRVYENFPEPFILLIDIKSDAEKTYKALIPLLERYRSILTECVDGKITNHAVTIILSGHKPYEILQSEKHRLAFIDQSLLNLNENIPAALCSLASAKYSSVIHWNGKGEMTLEDKKKLMQLTHNAHAQGKKVRLWATPENKNTWKQLLKCGVDLINTDKLEELRVFLTEQ